MRRISYKLIYHTNDMNGYITQEFMYKCVAAHVLTTSAAISKENDATGRGSDIRLTIHPVCIGRISE